MKVRSSSLTKWLLVFLILAAGCNDEESRRQLGVLHQIAADTPVYPGFVQLRNSDLHKTSHAAVIRCYSARADDADVKRFYSRVFASKGWTIAGEEQLQGLYPEGSYQLTFRKGAYAVELGHTNRDPSNGECNYSLTYFWNPPTPLIYGGFILDKESEYEIARFADGTINSAFANTSPGYSWINTGYVAPLNQWTHLTITYNSGVVKTDQRR